MSAPDISAVKTYLLNLQDRICAALEQEDGKEKFREDSWDPARGRRRTHPGCSPTARCSNRPGSISPTCTGRPAALGHARTGPNWRGASFEALGVSLVIHPRNPYVPTSHANVRFFMRRKAGRRTGLVVRRRLRSHAVLRFRGRRVHWHRTARAACAPSGRMSTRASRSGATTTSSSSTATNRAASAGCSSTISTSGASTRASPSCAASATITCRPICRIVQNAQGHALRRARARVPAVPARALRRVQPGLRPRHAVRPAVRRAHRIDPDVAAAAGAVAL